MLVDISIEVVFEIFFLSLSNTNLEFNTRKLT